jgi:hypothetical protein
MEKRAGVRRAKERKRSRKKSLDHELEWASRKNGRFAFFRTARWRKEKGSTGKEK